jgi:hypothetical protein
VFYPSVISLHQPAGASIPLFYFQGITYLRCNRQHLVR